MVIKELTQLFGLAAAVLFPGPAIVVVTDTDSTSTIVT